MLKLTIINDDESSPHFRNNHGWSILVELSGKRILFDADTNPSTMAYNLSRLKIDPNDIDFAILSHFHKDHYGGFKYIGNEKPGLKVYTPVGDIKTLLDWNLNPEQIIEPTEIIPGLWSSGSIYSQSKALYEQAIGINLDSVGIIVIVGCSHPGVDVLVNRLREIIGNEVFMVIGGFHEPPIDTLERLTKIAKYICPTHCSGDNAKKYIKEHHQYYCEVRTGSTISISNDQKINIEY